MKETGALAHCNALSLSLHQYARSPRVWWSDRACGAIRFKKWSVCQQGDARFCIHSWNVCLTHSVLFRCQSLVVVRCFTCRSIENFWRHLQLQRCSRFSSLQCSCPRRDSLHLRSLDAITLWRRPIAEIEETQVVSNSGPEQELCLFDHMRKFGPSSPVVHNEVAPERGLHSTAVAEERWKLFSLIEEGLTRCWDLCQGVLSPYVPSLHRKKAGGVIGSLRHVGTKR